MKLALYADLRNPGDSGSTWTDHYARWLDRAQIADELGAAEIWLSEHHFYDDGYLPQPLTFAAAIAGRTSRMRIGTAVLLIGLRSALQIAEEAAVVDVLSGGRLDLGVGVGYRPEEYEAFGADISRRYRLLEERVTQARALWRTGRVTPGPVGGDIPFWGGFFGPRGARLAGRLGMGLLPQSTVAHALMTPYAEGLVEGGFAPEDARLRFAVPFFLADDPAAVQPVIDERQKYQLDSYQRHGVAGRLGPKVVVNASSVSGRTSATASEYPAVRPETAAELIAAATAGLPVDQIYNWTSPGYMPDHLVDRHIELLFTELAPLVADM